MRNRKNLNQKFPALKTHIKKFNSAGNNTLYFRMSYIKFHTVFI